MFINYNPQQSTFRANTFRNNGYDCDNDLELMECINDGSEATCSVEAASMLFDAHKNGDYALELHIAESLSQAISQATGS